METNNPMRFLDEDHRLLIEYGDFPLWYAHRILNTFKVKYKDLRFVPEKYWKMIMVCADKIEQDKRYHDIIFERSNEFPKQRVVK